MTPARWTCTNALTTRCDDRWWLSVYGVVLCLTCQPPAFSWLVQAQGTAAEAPLVEVGRTSTLAADGRLT